MTTRLATCSNGSSCSKWRWPAPPSCPSSFTAALPITVRTPGATCCALSEKTGRQADSVASSTASPGLPIMLVRRLTWDSWSPSPATSPSPRHKTFATRPALSRSVACLSRPTALTLHRRPIADSAMNPPSWLKSPARSARFIIFPVRKSDSKRPPISTTFSGLQNPTEVLRFPTRWCRAASLQLRETSRLLLHLNLMAESFDIVSKVDMQEVSNAVLQALKEIHTRYDLKDSKSDIKIEEKEGLVLASADEYKLKAVNDVLQGKLVKRGVSLKALTYGAIEPAAGSTVRQRVSMQQGIPIEKAREIVKLIKNSKKKVQAAIQGDLVRVSGKDRDTLQEIIALLKQNDFGIDMQFTNYRSN